MKKRYITIGVIILFVILIVATVIIVRKNSSSNTTVAEETTTSVLDKEMNIHVDGWLKVKKVFEYNGKLAVVVENVSNSDVEYALLSAKAGEETFTFNMSVLLSGTEVIIVCNENKKIDANVSFTGWNTENIIYFEGKPSINDDKIEVSFTNNSILVKNVSDKDVTSDIFIYYKEKIDGMLNGNITHRVRVSGLKAGSQTYVNTKNVNGNDCQLMFIEYDD